MVGDSRLQSAACSQLLLRGSLRCYNSWLLQLRSSHVCAGVHSFASGIKVELLPINFHAALAEENVVVFLPWVKVLLNFFFLPPNLNMSKGINGVFD